MAEAATKTVVEETTDEDVARDSGWRTILFNCECHTFDEVERQLIKAVRCTLSQARRYSMEVHTSGSAVVYRGARERCEAAAAVLEEIGLLTQVCQ
jgi:ATP-dependent Clp protease adaptor protein ClpS